MQTVIMSVDRSPEDYVLVNTAVDLLHCPIRFEKAALKQLGYTAFRPAVLKPLVLAAVEREVARQGKIPLGGFVVRADDVRDLPMNPPK